MSDRHCTPLLDGVRWPSDLRKFEACSLRQLADELRKETISAVSVTGGHLGAGLGVVELTLALHYVFNTPDDKLIWDVGHQSYPHKIITGRRAKIRTLRQPKGLSGFTCREESLFDPFGAAHSSTSISAALGFAMADKLSDRPHRSIAVIGDGAMSAGMAFEAMNNVGSVGNRLIVILNDNEMSIAQPVGGLVSHLRKLASSRSTASLHKKIGHATNDPQRRPPDWSDTHELSRDPPAGMTIFEELGFVYVGPIDGHDLDDLVPALESVREMSAGPVLVHVITRKGRGYEPAERAPDRLHAVQRFNIATGGQLKPSASPPSYTEIFGKSLTAEAQRDPTVCAITAAMPSGTGLDGFQRAFPERMFDVGIAEQHAVTFAAGLAAQGMRPFVAIYSTFLQRAYDQVVHDVAIQNLPVRFAIDRAGLVGADGGTHAGAFDLAYLCTLPNMVVMVPSDETELAHMVHTAALYDNGPIAFRYPRGCGHGAPRPENPKLLDIGKGRVVRRGKTIALLTLGPRLQEALDAAAELEAFGLSTTVADLRFAKPLDRELIYNICREHEVIITVEEGAVGGLGAHVLTLASDLGLTDQGLKIRTLRLPDRFQPQDRLERQYEDAGLNCAGIVAAALACIGVSETSAQAV